MANHGGKRNGAGRKPGVPNKITLSVKEAVLETFQNLGGVKHMTKWAKDNPSDFYRIAAKLIPQQIEADVTQTHKVVSAEPLNSDEWEQRYGSNMEATGGTPKSLN